MRMKYPRTPHVPWSPGATDDDKRLQTMDHFRGKQVVVTEKMDGENTSLYYDGFHARSLDSRHHMSRDWVKALWGRLQHEIPHGWRVCGENLYAQHSIPYSDLPSYFLAFSVWNREVCLDWPTTLEWLGLLGLEHVPVLYEGVYDEDTIKTLWNDPEHQEGYVIRLYDPFLYSEFQTSVAKFVRAGHVQTDEHWMNLPLIKNGLTNGAK